ncbi:MAG: hypothetical protein AAF485_11135 [Chloroflexota bacterium]
MDKSLFNRLVAQLLPEMGNPTNRQAFIEGALYGSPSLQQIEWPGPADPFTKRLVRQLHEFGDVAPGRPALVALLQELKQQVGIDRQAEIDQLIHELTVQPADEKQYLQDIIETYEQWLHLYTDLSGRAEQAPKRPKVKVKSHVQKYLNTTNSIYHQRGYIEEGETRQVETVNQLREVVRAGGVVLIGEPGSGKTTTLQRLASRAAPAANTRSSSETGAT